MSNWITVREIILNQMPIKDFDKYCTQATFTELSDFMAECDKLASDEIHRENPDKTFITFCLNLRKIAEKQGTKLMKKGAFS